MTRRYTLTLCLLSVLLCGCASQPKKATQAEEVSPAEVIDQLASKSFTDESLVPRCEPKQGETGAEALFKAGFPRIVIDGHKLEYEAERRTFVYAGTDQRALWLEYYGENGVERILSTPTRKNPENPKHEQLFDGQIWIGRYWAESEDGKEVFDGVDKKWKPRPQ